MLTSWRVSHREFRPLTPSKAMITDGQVSGMLKPQESQSWGWQTHERAVVRSLTADRTKQAEVASSTAQESCSCVAW